RFTSLAQKYAVNSNLWRRKLQEKEEGRSLTGTHKRPLEIPMEDGTVRVVCSDPDAETEKVSQLLQAVNEARRRTGQSSLDPAAFHKVIKDKTKQFKAQGCEKVLFTVSVEQGKVKFKAARGE